MNERHVVTTPARPSWVTPLADQAGRATWADLSRFAPPQDGSGRASAVLVLLAETASTFSPAEPGTTEPAESRLIGPRPTGPRPTGPGSTEAGPTGPRPTGPGSIEAGPTGPGPAQPGRGPAVVLLERAATMRRHAGQVAFPGGAVDPGDADLAGTALREAEEEIGLDPASVDVLVTLPALYLPPSDFVVTPVLGYWRVPHPLVRMQPGEVSGVAVVSVAELVDPVNRFTVRHPSGHVGPGFTAGGLFVWGFTAGVLDAVLRMGGWERGWDVDVTRPLPAVLDPVAGTVEE